MSKTALMPPKVFNRLRAVMLHVPFYSIEGSIRLATEVGVSQATISRLGSQKNNPSFLLAESIAWAISKHSGIKLESQEIFSSGGAYPTESVCQLMGCAGCFPPQAWDERTDTLKSEWRHQKPGEWSRL